VGWGIVDLSKIKFNFFIRDMIKKKEIGGDGNKADSKHRKTKKHVTQNKG